MIYHCFWIMTNIFTITCCFRKNDPYEAVDRIVKGIYVLSFLISCVNNVDSV